MTTKESIQSNTPRIPRRKPLQANIGIFGVGHHTYWPQFEGMLDEMHRKLGVLAAKVRACGANVTEFGLVDDARGAYALRERLRGGAARPDFLRYGDLCHLGHLRRADPRPRRAHRAGGSATPPVP